MLTFIQHSFRRAGSKEQHSVVRLGVIFKPQAPKVRPPLVMEITKLHPVIVLVCNDLPQQRDFRRGVQENRVRLVGGLLNNENHGYRRYTRAYAR